MDISNVPSDFQINVIDLQSDITLKLAFKKKTTWWISMEVSLLKATKKLKRFARQIITMFGSTYICEQTFSVLNY